MSPDDNPAYERHVSLRCDDSGLQDITAIVEELAAGGRLRPEARPRLRLVLEELLSNVLMHGQAPEDGQVSLTIAWRRADGLCITWRDPGRPFNPETDLQADRRVGDLAERPVGGNGWHIIKSYCRLESWERKAGHNVLRLLFNTGPAPVSAAGAGA